MRGRSRSPAVVRTASRTVSIDRFCGNPGSHKMLDDSVTYWIFGREEGEQILYVAGSFRMNAAQARRRIQPWSYRSTITMTTMRRMRPKPPPIYIEGSPFG